MKLNKEYVKQISLAICGFLLIGIGYLNYSLDFKKNDNDEIARQSLNEINLGDVELVNTEPIAKIEEIGNIVPNDELEKIKKAENINDEEIKNELKSEEKNEEDYFEVTRLNREKMYSEMIETYENLIKNESTPNDQKAISVQEISNITNIKNGIMISENLIKNKGFEDVVILVNNDTASVVVKSYNLNQEQISKIQNIIQRELKIETKNINISKKF